MNEKIVSLEEMNLEKTYQEVVDIISTGKFIYNLEYDLRSKELRDFIRDIYSFYVHGNCVYKFNDYVKIYFNSIIQDASIQIKKPIINKSYLIESIINNQYLLSPDKLDATGYDVQDRTNNVVHYKDNSMATFSKKRNIVRYKWGE